MRHSYTKSKDCPHPARKGRHEEYARPDGSSFCRACGAELAQQAADAGPQAADAGPPNEIDHYYAFEQELAAVLNRNNIDTRHDTPDFILAQYVVEVLRAAEHKGRAVAAWNSDDMQKPSIIMERE